MEILGSCQDGSCFHIGHGENISIWLDPWIPPNRHLSRPRNENTLLDDSTTVADVILPFDWCWNEGMIQNLFFDEDANNILNILNFSSAISEDKLLSMLWIAGKFSIKSV